MRPAVDDPDQLIPFVVKQANDSLLVAEAEHLGLDENPAVIPTVDKARRRKTLFAFYEFAAREAKVTEEEARAFYAANAKHYNISEGYTISKIVVGTKEAADSVIVRLAVGEAFEEIARVRSRDPFTAPSGGYVGFYEGRGRSGVRRLPEDYGGRRAEDVFSSLEGYVVLWLMEYHTPRAATFDEARAPIERAAAGQEGRGRRQMDRREAQGRRGCDQRADPGPAGLADVAGVAGCRA